MTKVRCAIYTRKSSEEGLEQDFNSLDAQYEACAAYVKSQASEGWKLSKCRYDDGGLSGGSLDRPALQRLLDDVADGRIDIVVVYKVDRLTRSLFDFAKLVEAFDKAKVSFVSVTQSFNTTTSMGRLTLNMLLSFAQFEREVTAERIRDKIAASKAKGMWMGGTPPLGYEPDGRSLRIVEEHAPIIRDLFERYATIGNVRLVASSLKDDGMNVPVRVSGAGRSFGGGPFTRGQIYSILRNPIYVGRIRHCEKTYPGNHQAIIDDDLWQKVQEQLSQSINGRRRKIEARHPSLLAGKLFDKAGEPLVAAHANKGSRRYRYYVSRALQHGGENDDQEGLRLPATEIEAVVTRELGKLLERPIDLLGELDVETDAPAMKRVIARAGNLMNELRKENRTGRNHLLQDLVERIEIGEDSITIRFQVRAIAEAVGVAVRETDTHGAIIRHLPVTLKRSGMAMKLVDTSGVPVNPVVDLALIRAILRGRQWWQHLKDNPNASVRELAERAGVTATWVVRLIKLSFLSPAVIDAIIESRLPSHLSLLYLQATRAIPAKWPDQAKAFNLQIR